MGDLRPGIGDILRAISGYPFLLYSEPFIEGVTYPVARVEAEELFLYLGKEPRVYSNHKVWSFSRQNIFYIHDHNINYAMEKVISLT